MDIPTHLKRVRSQKSDLTKSGTWDTSLLYTFDALPRKIPPSKLPGERFLRALQKLPEFRLLRTNAEATLDSQDTGEWRPQYYVGGGGYGKVGVWLKRNDKDEVVDEIALKEVQNCKDEHLWPESRQLGLRRRLLAEAGMQSQLNESKSENLVHLRDYKYFNQGADNDEKYADPDAPVMPPSGTEKWRFYHEFAPYGDLFALIFKYRYWNQYLPEPFLWHVFDSLAEAAEQLRDCTWANMPTLRSPRGPPNETDRMVHFDIKPENIFLSYSEHQLNDDQSNKSTYGGTKKYNYPVIKLGDYGLNLWTGEDDDTNPQRGRFSDVVRGTYDYMPPEMVFYGAWWKPLPYANWTMPFSSSLHPKQRSSIDRSGWPTDDRPILTNLKDSNFQYDEKLHVWAIGKVIYDLMSLSHSTDYWEKSTVDRDDFIIYDYNQLPDFDRTPFGGVPLNDPPPYTAELTNLVRDCLRPFWIKRIDVDEMRSRTVSAMEKWDDKYTLDDELIDPEEMSPDRGTAHPKLFYCRNDINKMPRGKEHFVIVENDGDLWTDRKIDDGFTYYKDMRDIVTHDPHWPELKPIWDDHTAKQFQNDSRWESLTHYAKWVKELKLTEVMKTYRLAPNGGLQRRATTMQSAALYNSDDDNYDDDDNYGNQNPYTLPRIPPRGRQPSSSPTPPRVSPMSPGPQGEILAAPQQAVSPGSWEAITSGLQQAWLPVQQPTARQPTPQQPIAEQSAEQQPILQQPVGQQPTDEQPTHTDQQLSGQELTRQQPTRAPNLPRRNPGRGGSLTPRPPQPWRSLSLPAPLPDPTDSITDPSDSEVEIAIRTLRNGRRISHYRPKNKNLKAFNDEYVRRRRGERVNAKVAPFLAHGTSKFQDAIRRRNERRWRSYERRRERFERRRVSAELNEQQRSAPLPDDRVAGVRSRVMFRPGIHRPDDWLHGWQGPGTQGNPITVDPNTNLTTNSHPTLTQAPPHPPSDQLRLPHQTTWSPSYLEAYTNSQTGHLPPIPPGVSPTDPSFAWHRGQRAYFRQDAFNRTWGWWVDEAMEDGGEWREVFVDGMGRPKVKGG